MKKKDTVQEQYLLRGASQVTRNWKYSVLSTCEANGFYYFSGVVLGLHPKKHNTSAMRPSYHIDLKGIA